MAQSARLALWLPRSARMASDRRFADLCSHTQEAKQMQHAEYGDIIQKNHHRRFSSMAMSLKWE